MTSRELFVRGCVEPAMPPMLPLCALSVVILLGRSSARTTPPTTLPEIEETVQGTERLLAMLDSPDPAHQVVVANLLSNRLPPPHFDGRGVVFPDYGTRARRQLSRKTWREEFAPEVRSFGKALLQRTSMDEAAVGAALLVFVGAPDDLPAITEAMTRFIDQTCDPAAEPAYMPGQFDPFLAASQAAIYRSAAPAADPQTTGEIAVYLGKLSTHSDWNPPGWRARMAEWQTHPSSFIRRIASPPYPLRRDGNGG